MTSVFVSHSIRDKEWRTAFDVVCARAGIRADAMEFERLQAPPWRDITNRIRESVAVFVLIGPDFPLELIHTNNWVAFEVGVAACAGKDVWVLEDKAQSKPFAIPKVDHYILCQPSWLQEVPPSKMFTHIREVLEIYADPNRAKLASSEFVPLKMHEEITLLFAQSLKKTLDISQPRWMKVICTNAECGVNFVMHTNMPEFDCPSCRKHIRTTLV